MGTLQGGDQRQPLPPLSHPPGCSAAADEAALEACHEELASARQALAAEAQAAQRFRRLALLAGAAAACLGMKLLFGGRSVGKCTGARSTLPEHHTVAAMAPMEAPVAQPPFCQLTVLPPGTAASLPMSTVRVEALSA